MPCVRRKSLDESGLQMKRRVVLGLLLAGGTGVVLASLFRRRFSDVSERVATKRKEKTVADCLAEYGGAVQERLGPYFAKAQVAYPPSGLVFVGLKEEKELEIYAAGVDGRYRFVRTYPILAASGHAGPKLREGDRQVPEGLYRIASLNPNSLYHLALRIG